MNFMRISIRFSSVIFAALLSGCLEIETTTTVNTDGTFQREIALKGDSTEVSRGCMLFQTDSSWTVVRRKGKDTSWVSTITKSFPDQMTFAEALKGDEGKSLAIRVGFEKRFLWFTTEYVYAETLLCYNQIDAVPISKYLTPAEIDLWMRHEKGEMDQRFASKEDSLAFERIEKIGPEWDSRNKFEAFFSVFLGGVEKLNSPALTPAAVTAMKESLFIRCEPSLQLSSGKVDTLAEIVEAVLKTPLVRLAFEANAEDLQLYERKVKSQEELLGTPYGQASIIMPGLITSTNAESIEGNILSWKGFMPKCYIADFAMWAHSRVVNWWAVVLTGVVVVGLTLLLVVGVVGRRKAGAN